MRFISKKFLILIICTILFLISLENVVGQPGLASPWCDNSWTCTADDVYVTKVYLTNIDPCSKPGDIVSATLRVVVCNNADAEHYCLYLSATLVNITDGTSYEINQLIPSGSVIPGKTCTEYDLSQITWHYGDKLSLDVHLLSWSVFDPVWIMPCQDSLTCTARPSSQCSKEYTLNVTPVVPGIPGIAIEKQANLKSATVGDIIMYTYNITNKGNINLTGINISDSRGLAVTFDGGDLNTDHYLNLSEIWKYTANYTVTQGDICGNITNDATVTAETLCPGNLLSNTSSLVTVTTYYNASMNISKVANTAGPVSPGQIIKYTIAVCNIGNSTLNSVTVRDSLTGSHSIGSLSSGACQSYDVDYLVTQQDACNGSVTNSAYAMATDYCGKPVITETNASISIPVEHNASMSISKVADTTGPVSLGQIIKYTITVCNTGNLTLNSITLQDSLTGPHSIGSLSSGACQSYDVDYLVTQQDICNGSVTNSAYAMATDQCGKPVITETNAGNNVSIKTTYNASLELDKTANFGPAPNNPANMSDTINYTITVKNTGNVTLYKVNVTDDKLSLADQIDILPPGASKIYDLSYKVRESDLCRSINNEAQANATDPCGKVLENVKAVWSIPTTYKAAIKIEKSADLSSAEVGDVINYTYNVTNTGNVNLSNLELEDDKLGLIDTERRL